MFRRHLRHFRGAPHPDLKLVFVCTRSVFFGVLNEPFNPIKMHGISYVKVVCQYCPLLYNIVHFFPLLSNIFRYCPIFSSIVQCFPVLSNIFHYCPIFSTVVQYFSVLSNIFHYYPIFSTIVQYFPVLSSLLQYHPVFYYNSDLFNDAVSCYDYRISVMDKRMNDSYVLVEKY